MSEMKCRGWWEQAGYGRQEMNALELQFSEKRLAGSGFDIVGPFVLDGISEDGKVVITKSYTGRHQVVYAGTYDGEGTFRGQWKLGFDRGTWLIRIEKTKTTQISDANEIPVFEPV